MTEKSIQTAIMSAMGCGFQKEICDFLVNEGFKVNDAPHPYDSNIKVLVYQFDYSPVPAVHVHMRVEPFGHIVVEVKKGENVIEQQMLDFDNHYLNTFDLIFKKKYEEALGIIANAVRYADTIQKQMLDEKRKEDRLNLQR